VIRQDISFQKLQGDGDGRPGAEFLAVSDEEPGDDRECEGDEADQRRSPGEGQVVVHDLWVEGIGWRF
jgi:hypothetical protein